MDGLCLSCHPVLPVPSSCIIRASFPFPWPQSPQTSSGPSWPDRSPDTVRGESLRPCPVSERFPQAFGPAARGRAQRGCHSEPSAGFFLWPLLARLAAHHQPAYGRVLFGRRVGSGVRETWLGPLVLTHSDGPHTAPARTPPGPREERTCLQGWMGRMGRHARSGGGVACRGVLCMGSCPWQTPRPSTWGPQACGLAWGPVGTWASLGYPPYQALEAGSV